MRSVSYPLGVWMRRTAALALSLCLVSTCRPAGESNHEREIMNWRADRVARLKARDGWLTLTGLHWLQEGPNPVGSDPSNRIVIKAKVPPQLGTLVVDKGSVTLQPNPAAGLTIDGKPVSLPVPLAADTEPNGPTVVLVGTVRFQVIRRNERLGLRVKDSESEARRNFRGIDYFPIAPKWRVDARFEPFKPPRKVPIPNVIGITTEEIAPGLLAFTVDGREYRIEPILEEGTKDYFIIFRDQTSGKETYGSGRFVYAPPPDPSGHTVIDFNEAYNPPCAFTPFATCPLPPPQNRLPFRVTAGEKKYAGGHEG